MTNQESEIVAALASEIGDLIAGLAPDDRDESMVNAITIINERITAASAIEERATQKMIDAAIRAFLDERSLFSEQTKRHIRVSIHPAMRRALNAALAAAPQPDHAEAVARARCDGAAEVVASIRKASDQVMRDVRLVASGPDDPWRRGVVYALTKIRDAIAIAEEGATK